jgi:predicted kinase
MKIILTTGAPASGKSFWTKQTMAKEPGKWKRINFDDLRSTIDGGVYSVANEQIIINTRNFLITEAIKNDFNIIIDNTHILDKGKHFKNIVKLARSLNKDIEVSEKHFYLDLEKLIERDKNRDAKVGEEVINKFWKASGGTQFENYTPRKEILLARKIEPVNNNPDCEEAIICDLDGTMALFDRNPYDATNCHLDRLNDPVAKVVRAMKHFYNYTIIFCSGREEKYRAPTIKFLEKNLPEIKYHLFMRASNDTRSDDDVKEEIFRNNIEGKFYVPFILDDRNKVVSRWRALGLTCFQVAEGNF